MPQSVNGNGGAFNQPPPATSCHLLLIQPVTDSSSQPPRAVGTPESQALISTCEGLRSRKCRQLS